ncbi:BAR/IMD domain-containing adapter protein 2-like 1 isoform X2 [Hydra vulgaris]|uniref:BAR/IMD domain-containing adapter protein 2-like 1 isoform X2 n=1 Tax=Hydra vulgaris TaxID=6087 RepID=A0ABM4CDK3_HYDVU
MDNELNELNELHTLAVTTFQNVANLTPSLRQMVASAKVYQKSIQTTCNFAVMFVESMQNVANAALVSEGATKVLGDVLSDIIDAFKEIENIKLELAKVFINEVIIPLESKVEIQLGNVKTTHKNYSQLNKAQSEAVEKVRSSVLKVRRRSLRKRRPSQKYEEKERQALNALSLEETKLKEVREQGLRDALVEERRLYCFVADRMCSYGKGIVLFNNKINSFINQKVPDWLQFISKPTELPPESENIITNPLGYKIGTVKKKVIKPDRKDTLRRGKSFNNHYPTKYSTLDGRSIRGSSRPSISNFALSSRGNLTDAASQARSLSGSTSPTHSEKDTQEVTNTTSSYTNDWDESKIVEEQQIKIPTNEKVEDNSPAKSEYANVNILNQKFDDVSISRCHSYSGNRIELNKTIEQNSSSAILRMESEISHKEHKSYEPSEDSLEASDFRSRLASIQNLLNQRQVKEKTVVKNRLKAIYAHTARDGSQLTFEKGDIIIPICEPTSGWQYGENEKTGLSGWYPAAYTEEVVISTISCNKSGATPNATYLSSFNQYKSATLHKASHKTAPIVAKKSAKITAKKTSIVATLGNSEQNNENPRTQSTSGSPRIRSANSMPHMVHEIENSKNEKLDVAASKQRTSLQQSFDDSFDDEEMDANFNMPPPPPPPIFSESELAVLN